VYLADLDADLPPRQRHEPPFLSPAEQARADALKRPVDRRRFIASRRHLRRLLEDATGLPPDLIAFEYGLHGKPRLAQSPLRFNCSRTRNWLAVALTHAGNIGVDIENRVDQSTVEELAAKVLDDAEIHSLTALPAAERPLAFTRFWTVKEAVLKASGEGLSRDPREIVVELSRAAVHLARLPDAYGESRHWRAGILETGITGCCLAFALQLDSPSA
jgi:4'-phosphopantetheinyl transferase